LRFARLQDHSATFINSNQTHNWSVAAGIIFGQREVHQKQDKVNNVTPIASLILPHLITITSLATLNVIAYLTLRKVA